MLGVSYVDFAGISRMKPVTSGNLDAMLRSGVKTSRANFALSHNDSLVRGASMNVSQGDLSVVPDPKTFVTPAYSPGVGRFMGDVHEKDGSVSELCTRSFLKRVLYRAASKGYRVSMGFEGEFHLLGLEEGEARHIDNFYTHSQDGFNVYQDFIKDLVEALGSVGVETTKAHVEGGRGQLEFDIKHHEGIKTADDIVYFKEATGVQSVPYEDSVEEALCFGWIDSQIRRLDGQRYARKFSPRRPGSRWSPSNIDRAQRLIKDGRMNEAGLHQVDDAISSGAWQAPKSKLRNVQVPKSLGVALAQNPKAKANFEGMAGSYRDDFSAWVAAAKSDATIQKRVTEAVAKLERNEKLGLK